MILEPLHVIQDLLRDLIGYTFAGFFRIVVPDLIEPLGGIF